MKNNEKTKDIPVIVLTNFSQENKVQQAKDLGAVDFISLQGHAIKMIPDIFKRYLNSPSKFIPINLKFRE